MMVNLVDFDRIKLISLKRKKNTIKRWIQTYDIIHLNDKFNGIFLFLP